MLKLSKISQSEKLCQNSSVSSILAIASQSFWPPQTTYGQSYEPVCICESFFAYTHWCEITESLGIFKLTVLGICASTVVKLNPRSITGRYWTCGSLILVATAKLFSKAGIPTYIHT